MKTLVIASALFGLTMATAQAVEFGSAQLDKSKVGFTFKQMGVPVEGAFKRFTPKLAFDPVKPEKSTVGFEIDVASIDAGSSEANDEVKSPVWFNTKAFPSAKFASTAMRSLGGGKYEVVGTLTIKGRSKEATAPFTFKQDGNVGTFEGAFTIKRGDYAIGEGEWADFGTVANEVQIRFRVVAAAATK